MKFLRLFAILAVSMALVCGASHADTSKDNIPNLVHFDGVSWNRIDRISPEWVNTFKSFLVRGIYEGAYTANPKMFGERFNNDTGTREIVSALDAYYMDENNLRTPVSYAIMLVLKGPEFQETAAPIQGSTLISKGSNS